MLKKLKKAQTPKKKGNANKAWKFMLKKIEGEYWKLINGIWKGESTPGDWNKGVIYKRRKRA